MRRWLALGLALLLLPSVRADWLQPGYDAAQTGNTPEAGPAWDDVVADLRISVNDQPIAPLIVNGSAYIAYREPDPSLRNVIVRVPLASPEVDNLTTFIGGFVKGIATDGQSLFALSDGGFVDAFRLADGQPLWRVPVAPLPQGDPGPDATIGRRTYATNCLVGRMLVAAGHVVVACDAHQGLLYVASYAAAEGRLEWDYLGTGAQAAVLGAEAGAEALPRTAESTPPPGGSLVVPTGLSRLGKHILVASLVVEGIPQGGAGTMDGSSRGTASYGQYTALDEGNVMWSASTGAGADAEARVAGNQGSANTPPPATGTSDITFLELTAVLAHETDGTATRGQAIIRAQGSQLEGDPGSGFALAQEGLYATSRNALFRLDGSMVVQASTLAPDGQEWGPGPLLHAGNGVLYARMGADGAGFGGMHANVAALRSNDLGVLWTHRFRSDAAFAVSDGLMVVWCEDGALTILGHTAASPQPVAKLSTTIPAPGDLVKVDLSGSGAGLFGNVTQYRADWGDGTVTDWQSTPVLEHRFSSLTNVQSRFFVKNDANQTASATQLFVVGGQADLTFLQRQFSAENQNTTFFVLGLLATALAALWGVVQIRRSHHRLRRELKALEERLVALQGRPESLDEALRGARVRAQDLLTQRRLDQAQYLVLRERIEDLQRGLRMSVVDERLSFLPHGMVKRLEAMLADAKVTGWERHHFLEALDAERSLNPEQRRQVRSLVDGWFANDKAALGDATSR